MRLTSAGEPSSAGAWSASARWRCSRCWIRGSCRPPRRPPAAVARRHQSLAPRREGQAGHLPLSGRRPVASRDVRLQAEAGGDERPADARVDHQGTAARATAAAEADVLRAAVRVQEVRQVRPGDGRDLPAHRQRRRRPVHRPIDVRRADQSRSRAPDHEQRVDSAPAGRASARGCSTAWARNRRTCPASS